MKKLLILILAISTQTFAQNELKQDSIQQILLKNKSLSEAQKSQLYIKMCIWGSNYQENLTYAQEALKFARKSGNDTLIANAYNEIGYQQGILGDIRSSFDNYLNALRLYETNGIERGIYTVNTQIAINYYTIKDYQLAIDYTKRAISSFAEGNDIPMLERSILNIGEYFRMLKKYDSAKFYLHQALIMNFQTKNNQSLSYELGNLGMVFEETGVYDSARTLLTRSISIIEKLQDPYAQSVYQASLGRVNIEEGNKSVGESMLLASLDMADKERLKEQVRDFSRDLYLYYKSEGDHEKSLFYHEKFILYKDSLQNLENVKQIERTRSNYEIEKRENEIGTLNLANDLKRNVITAVSAGVVLLLGLMYLLFRANKREKITNKALQKSKSVIQESLAEKEVLIREIHHRVKNNLQIISSLLELQAFSEKDKKVQESIQKSQKRLQSIALIHQELYQQENLAKVNLKDYLEKLINTLLAFFTDISTEVKVNTEIENIEYDIESAAPIGLIMNELITNAYKYAFIGRKQGNIYVSVKKVGDTGLALIFKDDGVGLPENFDLKRAKSLGLRLISILTRQIKGEVSFYNDNGAHFKVIIKDKVA